MAPHTIYNLGHYKCHYLSFTDLEDEQKLATPSLFMEPL